jgi:hypothetical protein
VISFRFSRPKFVYGIERGVVARRLVMVYVPFYTDKNFGEGVGRERLDPTWGNDTRGGAESMARTAWDERQRVFSASTVLSEPAGAVDQGRRKSVLPHGLPGRADHGRRGA